MPPISAQIEFDDRVIPLPDIQPDAPASFTDHEPDNPSVLIISCNPDESGGIIYRQDQESTVEVLNRKLRRISSSEGDLVAVIGEGASIDVNVTLKAGEAVLKLSHYTID
jgi:uncharacterized protein (UPF0261 family)